MAAARSLSEIDEAAEIDWEDAAVHVGTKNAHECRARWMHHETPTINTSKWTKYEEKKLLLLVESHPEMVGLYAS